MSGEIVDKYELKDAIKFYQDIPEDATLEDIKMDEQLYTWLHELSQKRSIDRIKKHDINHDINTYTKMIMDALYHVFDVDSIHVTRNENSVLLQTPIAFIDFVNDGGFVTCILTLKDDAFNVAVANLMDVIKDVFKGEVIISDDTYILSSITNEVIVGEEAIRNYRENTTGKKVSPFVYYGEWNSEEKSGGHC